MAERLSDTLDAYAKALQPKKATQTEQHPLSTYFELFHQIRALKERITALEQAFADLLEQNQHVPLPGVEASDRLAYTLQEVSVQIGLSVPYLRQCIKTGTLNAKRFGRRLLITQSELNRFIANADTDCFEDFEYEDFDSTLELFDIDTDS